MAFWKGSFRLRLGLPELFLWWGGGFPKRKDMMAMDCCSFFTPWRPWSLVTSLLTHYTDISAIYLYVAVQKTGPLVVIWYPGWSWKVCTLHSLLSKFELYIYINQNMHGFFSGKARRWTHEKKGDPSRCERNRLRPPIARLSKWSLSLQALSEEQNKNQFLCCCFGLP